MASSEVASPVGSRPVLLLASGSPRRLQLLTSIGVSPLVVPVDVDETPSSGEAPDRLVGRLAEAKASAGWRWYESTHGGGSAVDRSRCLVVGADTVVAVDNEVLGKPTDDQDAATTLRRLSGLTHQVYTGVAVVGASPADGSVRHQGTVVRTDVTFRSLPEHEIDWYVATGEGRDKAGSYGIQGQGSLLVARIDGSYTNVVGLPVTAVDDLAGKMGRPLRHFIGQPVAVAS